MGTPLENNTTELQDILAEVEALPSEAVLYSEQALTDEQKAQARENIGAANSSDVLTTDNYEKIIGVAVLNSGKEIVNSSVTNVTILPNMFYVFGTVTSLNIAFGDEIPDITNEYAFEFTCGSTAATLIVPNTVKWVVAPVIEANKTYQVSVLRNIGVIVGV